MFKFYDMNEDGSKGALLKETVPSDDFYFDFFGGLSESPHGTIMEVEYDGRICNRFVIKHEFKAPDTKECNPCKKDGYHHYCTGCELHDEDCTCYNNWYAENKRV